MRRHVLSRLVLLSPLLLSPLLVLTGCAVLLGSIKQGTASIFEHGSVDIAVIEGELPELGSFALTQGGTYDGWAMEDGTNESMDGSHVVFESDEGWHLYIDHFLHSESYDPVQLSLRYEPDDGETTYGFSCASDDLLMTEERFSGTLECSKVLPSKPPPIRATVVFEATP